MWFFVQNAKKLSVTPVCILGIYDGDDDDIVRYFENNRTGRERETKRERQNNYTVNNKTIWALGKSMAVVDEI